MTEQRLLREARAAMEGITDGGWQPFIRGDTIAVIRPRKTKERAKLYEIIHWTGFDGSSVEKRSVKAANSRFIAWCGNGGVRRLCDELEAAHARIEELEARDG